MQEPLGSALSASRCAPTLDRGAISDCHFQIGGRHSSISTAQPPNLAGEVAIYREMAKRIGASRGVVVQTAAHGTDNRYTLDALTALGDGYRAVVSIDEPVDIRTLRQWHALGVRGVRFDQLRANVTTIVMLPVLTKHIACLGWHVELSMELRALRGCERMLRSLPVPVVLEHLGRTAPGNRGGQAALFRLLQSNNFWVKLLPPAATVDRPQTEDAVKTARRVVEARPDRILWGSDWPHILEQTTSPPESRLASPLFECTQNATIAQLILTENPMRLYGLSNDSHIRW